MWCTVRTRLRLAFSPAAGHAPLPRSPRRLSPEPRQATPLRRRLRVSLLERLLRRQEVVTLLRNAGRSHHPPSGAKSIQRSLKSKRPSHTAMNSSKKMGLRVRSTRRLTDAMEFEPELGVAPSLKREVIIAIKRFWPSTGCSSTFHQDRTAIVVARPAAANALGAEQERARQRRARRVPVRTGAAPFPYLNSGSTSTRARRDADRGEARHHPALCAYGADATKIDDQRYFTRYYLAHVDDVALDVHGALFRTRHHVAPADLRVFAGGRRRPKIPAEAAAAPPLWSDASRSGCSTATAVASRPSRTSARLARGLAAHVTQLAGGDWRVLLLW